MTAAMTWSAAGLRVRTAELNADSVTEACSGKHPARTSRREAERQNQGGPTRTARSKALSQTPSRVPQGLTNVGPDLPGCCQVTAPSIHFSPVLLVLVLCVGILVRAVGRGLDLDPLHLLAGPWQFFRDSTSNALARFCFAELCKRDGFRVSWVL